MRHGPVFLLALASPLGCLVAQADTAVTKAALLAEDAALVTAVASRGAIAFVERLAPNAAVLVPDAPIYRGATAARAPMLARYGPADVSASFSWTPQHAVVSTDGRLGCTVGITPFFVTVDTATPPRNGRYLTCWTRDANGAWWIAGHSRNGETPAIAEPEPDLNDPPHSAIEARAAAEVRAEPGDFALKAIVREDSAFAHLAVDSGPAIAFGRFAAADAMLLGGRVHPASGPAQIRATQAGFPKTGKFSWTPVRTLGAATGGLGFTAGEATIVANGETSHSKYITVWRQEPGGRWRYIFDLGSGVESKP